MAFGAVRCWRHGSPEGQLIPAPVPPSAKGTSAGGRWHLCAPPGLPPLVTLHSLPHWSNMPPCLLLLALGLSQRHLVRILRPRASHPLA